MKILLCLALFQTLTADGWLFLDTVQNKDGVAQGYVDPQTIQRSGDKVRAEVRITFPVGEFFRSFKRGYEMRDVWAMKGTLTFNCKKQSLSNAKTFFYDREDRELREYKHKENFKVKRDHVTWMAFQYLCEVPPK